MHSVDFPPFLTKQFCDLLFDFLHTNPLLKRILSVYTDSCFRMKQNNRQELFPLKEYPSPLNKTFLYYRGKRSLPQTRSYSGCGKQGVHVLLTKEFLTDDTVEPYTNNSGK